MASRSTRPSANRVEMCVLCGQSSFTSAQHISMWEVKGNSPPFWKRCSYRKKKKMHIYSLSTRFYIFIFELYCMWYDFVYVHISVPLCVFTLSLSQWKEDRTCFTCCMHPYVCVCVSVGVCECVTWVCFYWVISLLADLIWYWMVCAVWAECLGEDKVCNEKVVWVGSVKLLLMGLFSTFNEACAPCVP